MEPERERQERAGVPAAVRRRHAFEERSTPGAEPETIPWGYGEDRVTAMAVDPHRLYVYWEVTDAAIARARAALGRGGPRAWLNLRVYDTTGRLFDGTNAHSYFDHAIDRADRQYFFDIAKPSSEAFVDLGLRSEEGFFVKVARSGRVRFPRRDPAPLREPRWMTVRATGEAIEAAPSGAAPAAAAHREPHPEHGRGAPAFEPVPPWRLHVVGDRLYLAGVEEQHEWLGWEEVFRDGIVEAQRTETWEGPTLVTSWEAGPFSYPVEVAAPVVHAELGPTQRYQVGGRVHTVYGPWHVTIRGLGAWRARRVLARWEIHRTWIAGEGRIVRAASSSAVAVGASEQSALGASELRWQAASELRLAGASELFYLAASERRMLGASETVYLGASQWLLRGASERRFVGASELRLRGASERLAGGASERLGGSERRLGGSEAISLYPPVPVERS